MAGKFFAIVERHRVGAFINKEHLKGLTPFTFYSFIFTFYILTPFIFFLFFGGKKTGHYVLKKT